MSLDVRKRAEIENRADAGRRSCAKGSDNEKALGKDVGDLLGQIGAQEKKLREAHERISELEEEKAARARS